MQTIDQPQHAAHPHVIWNLQTHGIEIRRPLDPAAILRLAEAINAIVTLTGEKK